MKHFTLNGEIRQKGNKAVLKAYRRQDKYTYIYNPNEMRTVEVKSEK